MLLAIVSDQEWIVVEPDGRIRLENLDATGEVRLVPISGGRPTEVLGPTEYFDPAPTREQRQAWIEEGMLHAEIVLDRWANVSGCAGVFVAASAGEVGCASHRVLLAKLVTSCRRRTPSRRRRDSTTMRPSSWYGIPEMSATCSLGPRRLLEVPPESWRRRQRSTSRAGRLVKRRRSSRARPAAQMARTVMSERGAGRSSV